MKLFDKSDESTFETTADTRRGFLRKAAGGAAAVFAAMIGLARPDAAHAVRIVACCSLGSNTNCPCRGCCGCSGGKNWAWYCTHTDGRVWECGECYQGAQCNQAPYCCSWAWVGGLAPAP